MQRITYLITLILTINSFASAQELNDPSCPVDNYKERFIVESFLTEAHLQDERIESGTNEVETSEISIIEDKAICQNLDFLVSSHTLMKNIDDEEVKTKFYYKTNNFYFIFWLQLNQLLGPKFPIFIVNKNFELVGVYYI